jgi:hypothetical protein
MQPNQLRLFSHWFGVTCVLPSPSCSSVYCSVVHFAAARLLYLAVSPVTLRFNVIFSFIFHTLITFSHVTLPFSVMVNVIFSSAIVAAIIDYLLDCTHLYWEVSVRKDSGWHWWEKFYPLPMD